MWKDCYVFIKTYQNKIITYSEFRLRYFVSEGDFEMALKLANLLRGDPARIFNDWMRQEDENLQTE